MNALGLVSSEASLVRKRQLEPRDLEGSLFPFALGESDPGGEHMALAAEGAWPWRLRGQQPTDKRTSCHCLMAQVHRLLHPRLKMKSMAAGAESPCKEEESLVWIGMCARQG